MTHIEAMKQMANYIDALGGDSKKYRQVIATEESTQEPVALQVVNGEICYKSTDDDQSFGMWCPINYDSNHNFPENTKFYTHPQPKAEQEPKREPLTDEMLEQCPYSEQNPSCRKAFYYGWMKAEAAHGIGDKA